MLVCLYSVEVMNYVSRVAASKVRHGHADLLIVVLQVDANILLQLLVPTQRRIRRVFIENPAVEQVLPGVLRTHTHTRAHGQPTRAGCRFTEG